MEPPPGPPPEAAPLSPASDSAGVARAARDDVSTRYRRVRRASFLPDSAALAIGFRCASPRLPHARAAVPRAAALGASTLCTRARALACTLSAAPLPRPQLRPDVGAGHIWRGARRRPPSSPAGAGSRLPRAGPLAAAQVLRATSRSTGEAVAIKLIAEAVMHHPCICRLLGVFACPPSRVALVMELVDGRELHDIIACGGAMTECDAARAPAPAPARRSRSRAQPGRRRRRQVHVFMQLMDAVKYMHVVHNVCHRDLKARSVARAQSPHRRCSATAALVMLGTRACRIECLQRPCQTRRWPRRARLPRAPRWRTS